MLHRDGVDVTTRQNSSSARVGASARATATAAAPPQQTERQHIALEAQKARYAALTGLRVSRVTEAVLAPEV